MLLSRVLSRVVCVQAELAALGGGAAAAAAAPAEGGGAEGEEEEEEEDIGDLESEIFGDLF